MYSNILFCYQLKLHQLNDEHLQSVGVQISAQRHLGPDKKETKINDVDYRSHSSQVDNQPEFDATLAQNECNFKSLDTRQGCQKRLGLESYHFQLNSF